MTISNVSHTNEFLGDLKNEYDEKIEELNSIIKSLQEELQLMVLSNNVLYDL